MDKKKEYPICAIVFPDLIGDPIKEQAILKKMLGLIRSINEDYPNAIVVIYTPAISTFKQIEEHDSSVRVEYIQDLDIFGQGILNSVHVWATADNEKEEKTVVAMQEKFNKIKLYNVTTFI